ncbi:MAG TPA: hypothetical protein VIQ74_11400 [Gemmatimonadaceae bacterium]|jgi:hypothetical protein
MIPRLSATCWTMGVAVGLITVMGLPVAAAAQAATNAPSTIVGNATSVTSRPTAAITSVAGTWEPGSFSVARLPQRDPTMLGDTVLSRDTTLTGRDTTMVQDTTITGGDTTMMGGDTTMMGGDTSMMGGDTSMMGDTSTAGRDTTITTPDMTITSDSTAYSTDSATGAVTVTDETESNTADTYGGARRSGRFGEGFYVGVGGGASIPMGDLHDVGYDVGWNVTVPIGWQPSGSPLGLRLDVSYDRLNGSSENVGPVNVSLSDLNIWSGMLDLTLQFPLGGDGRSSIYFMAGGGVHRFTSSGDDDIAFGDDEDATTEPGVNGGVGFSFGLDRAKLFLESRFVSVFTEDNNSNYVPIILGIRF